MRHIFLLLLLVSLSFGLGHTSVTTLVFPHGSENVALGEAGTAFSNSLSSSFFNPANGALYGKRENIHFAFSGYYEELLPSLGLGDLWHHSINGGIFALDAFENWSFGFIYSMNKLHYGKMVGKIKSDTKMTESWYEYDLNGDSTLVWGYSDSCEAFENVQSFVFSAAYKNMFSWGMGISRYHSVLFVNAKDTGWVMNVGFRAQKEFINNNDIYIIPGAGIALNSFNLDSADYNRTDTIPGSPTPHQLNIGISVEGGIKDLIYGTFLLDINKEMVKDHKGNRDEPIFSPGLQIGVTPFLKFNSGFLLDDMGKRDEFHWGLTTGFQQQRVRNFLSKQFGYTPLNTDLNLQILYSFHKMYARGDNDIRMGQFGQTLTIAMGFGKSLFSKKEKESHIEEELQLWEE